MTLHTFIKISFAFLIVSLIGFVLLPVSKQAPVQAQVQEQSQYQCVEVPPEDPAYETSFATLAECQATGSYCSAGEVGQTRCSPTGRLLECAHRYDGSALAYIWYPLSSEQSCGDVPDDGSCFVKNQVTSVCTQVTPSQCTLAKQQNITTYLTQPLCEGSANTGQSCDGEEDCQGDALVCNGETNTCTPPNQAMGTECNENGPALSDGTPGHACCVGGTTIECGSGACSGSGVGTIGTCLGGGGPVSGPNCQENQLSCLGCGGFCSNDFTKTCNKQAFERCGEVITGGSCALTVPGGPDTYDEANNSCTHYCTNVLNKNGEACPNVNRPCQYVGPEHPKYQQICPTGNGYGDYGWNGQCFTEVPNNVVVTSYYCACPNNDCSSMGLGQGCQGQPQSGNACYQAGTCGILQVDIDTENPATGQSQHTSRNKFITSGCNVLPPGEVPDDDVIPPSSPQPSPSPATYFCNSNCTATSQCKTADDDFVCSTEQGNKCRLESNLGSATCQPAVGPQCLSISLTNVSNPTAPATADPAFGDAVTFTCGLVAQADHYIFRVIEPDGTIVNLTATGATSAQYNIDQSGAFVAQCQICTGAAESTCHAYEPPTN